MPFSIAPPVAASFASTMLQAEPVQVPSAKLTTSVLSVPMLFNLAATAPPAPTSKLCVDGTVLSHDAREGLRLRHASAQSALS